MDGKVHFCTRGPEASPLPTHLTASVPKRPNKNDNEARNMGPGGTSDNDRPHLLSTHTKYYSAVTDRLSVAHTSHGWDRDLGPKLDYAAYFCPLFILRCLFLLP